MERRTLRPYTDNMISFSHHVHSQSAHLGFCIEWCSLLLRALKSSLRSGLWFTSAQPMKLGWGSEGPDEAEEACVDSLASSVIIPAPSVPQEHPRSSGCLFSCCALNYTRPSHTRSLSSLSQSFINTSIFFSSRFPPTGEFFLATAGPSFLCGPSWFVLWLHKALWDTFGCDLVRYK